MDPRLPEQKVSSQGLPDLRTTRHGWSSSLPRSLPILALSLLVATATQANGPNIGRDPGGIFPVANDDIQLVSEEVSVAPGHDDDPGWARCVYHLRNLTDREHVLDVAFYIRSIGWGIASDYPIFASRLEFRATQDGRPLPVAVEKIDPARWQAVASAPVDSLPTWTMTIGPHEETRLVLDYQVVWTRGADGSTGYQELTYHARPASLWAGVIESAVIEFQLDPLTMKLIEEHRLTDERFELRIEPGGYEWTGNVIRWRLTDWDAAVDPEVSFSYRAW